VTPKDRREFVWIRRNKSRYHLVAIAVMQRCWQTGASRVPCSCGIKIEHTAVSALRPNELQCVKCLALYRRLPPFDPKDTK